MTCFETARSCGLLHVGVGCCIARLYGLFSGVTQSQCVHAALISCVVSLSSTVLMVQVQPYTLQQVGAAVCTALPIQHTHASLRLDGAALPPARKLAGGWQADASDTYRQAGASDKYPTCCVCAVLAAFQWLAAGCIMSTHQTYLQRMCAV